MSIISLLAVVAALLLLFCLASHYYSLVNLNHRLKNAFSPLEVPLKHHRHLTLSSTKAHLTHLGKTYGASGRNSAETMVNTGNKAVAVLKATTTDLCNATAIRNLSESENTLAIMLGELNSAITAQLELKIREFLLATSQEFHGAKNRIAFACHVFSYASTACKLYKRQFHRGHYRRDPWPTNRC